MAGRQRTFDLVPTTLANGGTKPPMTSKAAKKAYLQAQKGPRISRAEQRRRDAEELEKQRKEHEKEKAAARAKVAREKKAAKANLERESRKKMGLPEPSKFVRASQPTISKFVKTGDKRTWVDMEGVTEDLEVSEEGENTKQKDEAQPPAKRRAIELDSEDEFGDFPSLSQPGLLEKVDDFAALSETNIEVPIYPSEIGQISQEDGNANLASASPRVRVSTTSQISDRQSATSSRGSCQILSPEHHPRLISSQNSSRELPEHILDNRDDKISLDDLQLLADMVSTQLLSETLDAATRFNGPQAVLSHQQAPVYADTRTNPSPYQTPHQRTANKLGGGMSPRPSPHELLLDGPLVNVPPLPTQKGKIIVDRQVSRKRRKSPSPPGLVSQGHATNMPPPPIIRAKKTPTSQKSRTHRLSPPRPVLQERSINISPPPIQNVKYSTKPVSFAALPNTPRAIPRKRNLHQAPTKMDSNPALQAVPSATQVFLESHLDDFPSPSQQIRELMEDVDDLPSNTQIAKELSPPKQTFTNPLMDLFSSQDLTLSPQDLIEITTPSRALSHQSKEIPSLQLPPRERPRFFQEKEDDLLHAAIYESKALATAAEKVQKIQGPVNEAARSTRTLQRVQSTATDYGDDEFTGCSQELLALC